MIRILAQRWCVASLMVSLVAVTVLLLAPLPVKGVQENAEGWIDQLAGFVVNERSRASLVGEAERFDPYWGQLYLVRNLYERGDHHGTYVAMNHFMDMLEARANGISAQAADAIWDYCYQVTPPAFHDAQRHKQWWDKTVDWEDFFWGSEPAEEGVNKS